MRHKSNLNPEVFLEKRRVSESCACQGEISGCHDGECDQGHRCDGGINNHL